MCAVFRSLNLAWHWWLSQRSRNIQDPHPRVGSWESGLSISLSNVRERGLPGCLLTQCTSLPKDMGHIASVSLKKSWSKGILPIQNVSIFNFFKILKSFPVKALVCLIAQSTALGAEMFTLVNSDGIPHKSNRQELEWDDFIVRTVCISHTSPSVLTQAHSPSGTSSLAMRQQSWNWEPGCTWQCPTRLSHPQPGWG